MKKFEWIISLIIIFLGAIVVLFFTTYKSHGQTFVTLNKYMDCDHDGDFFTDKTEERECSLLTPTPIATISATPTSSPTPTITTSNIVTNNNDSQVNNSTTNPPGNPTCTIPFANPILQGYTQKNGIETYSWWPSTSSGITKESVEYGYEKGSPLYGADNLNPNVTSIAIQGLDITKQSWLRVCAWKNQCNSCSEWFN